jgi:3-hydroxyisobutyrate dehydrogenase
MVEVADKPQVGMVGLGTMGGGMVARLLKQGVAAAVHNRTLAKAAPLEKDGAIVMRTPAEVAENVDTVVLSLADQSAVETVLFGPDGVVGALRPGAVVVDTSTVAPAFARATAERVAEAGHEILDACILGNGNHARSGELRFMVGGALPVFQRVEPLLTLMGKEVTHLGDHGRGASMKILLNLLMGIEMQALAEAVVFGERSGLPRDVVLRTIAASGFSSPVMKFKCGVMGRRAFDPADFRLSLMRKDLGLVRSEAQDLGIPMAATEGAYAMLTAANQRGFGDQDVAAVLAYMEEISGVEQ